MESVVIKYISRVSASVEHVTLDMMSNWTKCADVV